MSEPPSFTPTPAAISAATPTAAAAATEVLRLDGALTRLDAFARAGFAVPAYDVARMRERTTTHPAWVHLGPGNFFRSLHATVAQRLLDDGAMDTGIVLVGTHDPRTIEHCHETDELFVNAVMDADGGIAPSLVASVAESHFLSAGTAEAWTRLIEVFTAPSLQLVTLTITEKGYKLRDPSGDLLPAAAYDVEHGPGDDTHATGVLTALLLERYRAGALPVAVVSTDNFSANGLRLAASVGELAELWAARGFVDDGFLGYLRDPARVAFPWSMVDRITPVPSPRVAEALGRLGLADTALVPREGASPLASFSNTEEISYLVIEDTFPNGRPPLERGGVRLADRETVNRADRMKVCTCLNPLHTAMAVVGCLLGYTSIAVEIRNPDVLGLVRGIGYVEGLPVVADPGIISPRDFLDEVVTRRFPNSGIPDTPQRIATDTSQKVAIRFGETLTAHAARGTGTTLRCIPFAIAAWVRYLLGVDDEGRPFRLSPDPLADYLHGFVNGIRLGDPASVGDRLRPLLSNAEVFGIDLYAAGVGPTVEGYVRELVAGPGAVARTLHEIVTDRTLTADSTITDRTIITDHDLTTEGADER